MYQIGTVKNQRYPVFSAEDNYRFHVTVTVYKLFDVQGLNGHSLTKLCQFIPVLPYQSDRLFLQSIK